MNNPITPTDGAMRDQMRRAIAQDRDTERRRAELRLWLWNCAYMMRSSEDLEHRTRAREAATELLNQLHDLNHVEK
jgi:hypothetical protein